MSHDDTRELTRAEKDYCHDLRRMTDGLLIQHIESKVKNALERKAKVNSGDHDAAKGKARALGEAINAAGLSPEKKTALGRLLGDVCMYYEECLR